MKLIPTRAQWNGWTLPSKASYIGCVIGIVALLFAGIIALFSNDYDKRADQPQLAVTFGSKPYLRHNLIGTSGMKFSYEICIRNLGKNPATRLTYAKQTQTLVVDGLTVAKAKGNGAKNRPPQRVVSGDHYCQLFSMSNTNMTAEQASNCLKKYDAGQLAIILELEIEYVDAITGREYSMSETNRVYRGRVEIL